MTTETERPPLEDVIADMGDDALAEMACEVKEEAYRQLRMAELAYRELRRRMAKAGATVLETDHWSGRLRPGAPFHIVQVPARLRARLLKILPAAEVEAGVFCPPPPPPDELKVNHRELNELRKRGGAIAEIIDDERRSDRGESKLELARKREVEVEQG